MDVHQNLLYLAESISVVEVDRQFDQNVCRGRSPLKEVHFSTSNCKPEGIQCQFLHSSPCKTFAKDMILTAAKKDPTAFTTGTKDWHRR